MSQDIDLTDVTDPEVVVLKPAAPGTAIYIGDVVTCVDSVTAMAYDRNQLECGVVSGRVCRAWRWLLVLQTRLWGLSCLAAESASNLSFTELNVASCSLPSSSLLSLSGFPLGCPSSVSSFAGTGGGAGRDPASAPAASRGEGGLSTDWVSVRVVTVARTGAGWRQVRPVLTWEVVGWWMA